jgi:hypothetical protein
VRREARSGSAALDPAAVEAGDVVLVDPVVVRSATEAGFAPPQPAATSAPTVNPIAATKTTFIPFSNEAAVSKATLKRH